MTRVTDAERIAAIQARVDAATPGEWTFRVRPNWYGTGSNHYTVEAPEHQWPNGQVGKLIAWFAGGMGDAMREKDERFPKIRDGEIEADAALIASCRQDIPYLLSALSERTRSLEQAGQENARLRAREGALHHALVRAEEWMAEEGCDCGQCDPECALCLTRHVLTLTPLATEVQAEREDHE